MRVLYEAVKSGGTALQSFRSFLYPLSVPAYFYFDRKTGKKQVSHCRTVASTGQGYLIQYLRPIMPENTGKCRKVPVSTGYQRKSGKSESHFCRTVALFSARGFPEIRDTKCVSYPHFEPRSEQKCIYLQMQKNRRHTLLAYLRLLLRIS